MGNPEVLSQESLHSLVPLVKRYAGSAVIGARGGYGFGDEAGAEFAFVKLQGKIETGELEAIAVSGRDGVEGALLWKRLEWDTGILGKECSRILLIAGADTDRLLSFWKERAATIGVRYTTVRFLEGRGAGCTDAEFSLWGVTYVQNLPMHLESAGFKRLERLVFFRRSTAAPDPLHEVRGIGEKDHEEILGIAASSYRYDRFHSEPIFSDEDADRLHREWARESLLGRADKVLQVCDAQGRVAGFCTCILPPKALDQPGWVDMLAVRGGERGRGFGEALLLEALRYFHHKGLEKAALSTQEHNLPALGLYDKLGFERYNEALTYSLVL